MTVLLHCYRQLCSLNCLIKYRHEIELKIRFARFSSPKHVAEVLFKQGLFKKLHEVFGTGSHRPLKLKARWPFAALAHRANDVKHLS